jgi:hypothetical protein
VDYGSFDPYTLTVYETSPLLSPWSRYEVWVCKSADRTYGHATDYGLHISSGRTRVQHIEACTADWTPEGVTLTEPTGHRLFIPKSAFIGGR